MQLDPGCTQRLSRREASCIDRTRTDEALDLAPLPVGLREHAVLTVRFELTLIAV